MKPGLLFIGFLMTSREAVCDSRPRAKRSGDDRRDGQLLTAAHPLRLKYCTARSCFSAAARVLKMPRFRRVPVLGFFLRE
jgi:hypothetical protein